MMKRILATLLVLALVAPAMANVGITATGSQELEQLTISFATTDTSVVRGIALTVNVAGATSSYVAASSSFNTFVDYAFSTPGYTVGAGQPLALETAAGVIGTPVAAGTPFAVSVGYLDEAGAQAGLTSGTVVVLQLDIPDGGSATVDITANATRGGAVVGDNLGAVTLPSQVIIPAKVNDWILGPAVAAKTTAAPAIATRVNGGRVETFTVSGVTGSSAVEYQFTFGDSTTSAWSTSTTATKTYTYAAATNYNVTVQARLVSNTAMSVTSAALALSSEAVKSTAAFYADWALYGRPNCWAFPRNCKGDVDGLKQGSALAGYTWVSTNDLSVLLAAFNIKEPTKGIGIMNIPGYPNAICADFDHLRQGSALAGYTRVSTNDLTPFLASFNIKEPTKGPGVAVCAQTNYHYWTGSL